MPNKKKRASKTSKGEHGGGGKVRGLTPVQKVLMNKGLYDSFHPIGKKHA